MFNFREMPEQQPELEYAEPEPAAEVSAAADIDDAVCPECSGQFHAYRTVGKLQYRKCKSCGHKGKSSKRD